MPRALLLVISLCLTIPVQGGAGGPRPAPAAQNPAQTAPNPESISPHLVEWMIDINEKIDLRQVWRMLKIEVPGDTSYRCDGGCSAETFDVDLDQGRDKAVALMISHEGAHFYQYLFFKKAGAGGGKEDWRLIGHVNSALQLYGAPAQRVESADGRAWLVIKDLWRGGEGIAEYGETWYDVGPEGVKPVLSYPVQGKLAPCAQPLWRSYKSILLRYGMDNGAYTVPVQFFVSYNIPDCERKDDPPPLFTRSRKAYFVWDEKRRQFALDRSRSEIADKGIDGLWGETLNNYQFIEEHFKELSDLATGGSAKQKDWLRQLLDRTQGGAAKAALQRALRQ